MWCTIKELKDSADGSVTTPSQYGQITIQEFRDLETFAKDSFFVTDEGLAGLFVYDPGDTTSVDNGVDVLVKNGKTYKRTSLSASSNTLNYNDSTQF